MPKKIDPMDKIKVQCPCGGATEKITTEWKGIPVRGWKCVKCGEEILHPLDAEKAMIIAMAIKNKELSVKIRKVGKSLTMTIPSKLVKYAELQEGTIANWGINSKKELVVEIVG
ncbi:MAG: hypothetical protein KKH41_04480 [Candidatus Thermoplasmatota archaeon]|nr:hypothetical protein [Candidatus Thermoplasmatota archaeon]MBU4070597.1 hypothetical protein [Candidatus Thermoplasmatota archaeon]MBU4144107.1 hypothetical protein [Candidatus Thermoplasmatota archaeon]MBU4591826.1 hypothetical protein [Candidatus Thermoplasmatota archaeon]